MRKKGLIRTARLPGFVLFLVLAAVSLCAQESGLFTPDFLPQDFARRRAAVAETIGSEAIAIVQGAAKVGGYIRFRQSDDFFYLCGIETPHAYLVIEGSQGRSFLFLPHRNERMERSEGKVLSAEDGDLAVKVTGIDDVFGTEFLAQYLARLSYGGQVKAVLTPYSPAELAAASRDMAALAVAEIASDPWDGRPSRQGHFIHLLKTRFPAFEVKNLTPIVDGLRLIKDEREIALIRRATRLAALAIMECMRSTAPGLMEYEISALAKFIFLREGAQGEAYYAIPASGPNTWNPHYHAGQRQMRDGELFLLDYAPDLGYYVSDLTRTWPVNGRFNDWQRELYGFYIACYKSILKAIQPGLTGFAVKQNAAREMEEILGRTKFSKPVYEKAARDFVSKFKNPSGPWGSVLGHWIGMAAHDVGEYGGPLKPGMTFTIEPALEVPEEKIYIRAEDAILITERGIEIMSDFLPRDIEDIENLMKENGLLQQHPSLQEFIRQKDVRKPS
jgi:Xaa-Pro aminopeptidase